ncbi:SMP-30/gluconolactonase/LRE family protein [Nocardioides sp. zg-1228]|uniref:SMP-30/gluconolactonase/LRE family protein n=1 Tax=Nocardioides sp. zg-1228 TaxID=2763008 RepID=UPI001F1197AB|nr:SMP-30/gluconolactonase/LRE family protein [Nocardioides sp. zg-1228]
MRTLTPVPVPEEAIRAAQLTDVVTHHGEGICWDPALSRLRLVDVSEGDLLTLDGERLESRLDVGAVVGAWRPRTNGGVVVATDDRFVLLDPTGALEWTSPSLFGPGRRMNDGGCDRQGRFYCGSMDVHAMPGQGTLWRLDPDRTVSPAITDLTIPNGLVWSVDGTRAFHVDTPRGSIDVLEHDGDTGALANRRPVAHVSGGDPDGMAQDAHGGLWVALWGGSAVHRYSLDGTLTAVVEVDAVQVSSCAFGGPGDTHLYITTSRQGLGESEDPAAGAVFCVDVAVEGAPVAAFSA